jgi:small subunit ribosomal protein S2
MSNHSEQTSTVTIPSLLELLKAGVHFGHLKSKWHPKMSPFIFSSRSGVHIINLEVTRQQLENAMRYISETVAKGGTILFVGTKKQVAELIKAKAEEVGMPYVHQRWIGGLLTNYSVISKMINRHGELGEKISSGKLDSLTKKDRLSLTREFNRLEEVVGGISKLNKIPDAVFLIDLKREKTALAEARKMNVPIVALCDTNVNPQKVNYPIASNDDAVGALKLMLDLLGEAVKEGISRRTIVNSVPVTPVVAVTTPQT